MHSKSSLRQILCDLLRNTDLLKTNKLQRLFSAKILLIFALSQSQINFGHALIFVHLGPQLPTYLPDALAQARLFNPNLDIFLLAEQPALAKYPANNLKIKLVATETISLTRTHLNFKKQTTLNTSFRDGFWRYTSERFLYLADFVLQHKLHDVFHIENDNLLYCDLTQLLPIFQKYYPGIAAVLDADHRCIPSVIYFATPQAADTLAAYFQKHAKTGNNDMDLIAQLRQTSHTNTVDTLPIIHTQYHVNIGLRSLTGLTPHHPQIYSNHLNEFKSLFDGAALGQFIGGIDPRNSTSPEYGPGFVNETCVFNPAKTEIFWQTDHLKRKVPYLKFADETYRINNLHIHCKDLAKFKS